MGKAFSIGREEAPTPKKMRVMALVRIFALLCPNASAATAACSIFSYRWFPPHFSIRTEFSLTAWDAKVEMARVYSPMCPACWIQCTDRSRRSSSWTLQNTWDVQIPELRFCAYGRLGSGYSQRVLPTMLMPPCSFGVRRPRLPSFEHTIQQGDQPLLIPAASLVEVDYPGALGDWERQPFFFPTDHADSSDVTNAGFLHQFSACTHFALPPQVQVGLQRPQGQ